MDPDQPAQREPLPPRQNDEPSAISSSRAYAVAVEDARQSWLRANAIFVACPHDTDGDGNCPLHLRGCPTAVEIASASGRLIRSRPLRRRS